MWAGSLNFGCDILQAGFDGVLAFGAHDGELNLIRHGWFVLSSAHDSLGSYVCKPAGIRNFLPGIRIVENLLKLGGQPTERVGVPLVDSGVLVEENAVNFCVLV